MEKQLQVIDFFCGAGGFSEGFRQQNFKIVMGIDNWVPAIDTHNLNHGLTDEASDILRFNTSVSEIDKVPNTEIIIGSPPCVLFSLSNRGGKMDKALGISLIESFLRVIAVKKHQPSSKLTAWFMENVPNSKNYIKSQYSFRDLRLTRWAKELGIDPDHIALNAGANGCVLNTADFGASQKRERFVCGEIVATGTFPDLAPFKKSEYRTIGMIRGQMPAPSIRRSAKQYADPNYPHLTLAADQITDHFYDSGVYESQWKSARAAKLDHPFMGRMSFPEDENKPSRTIMATRSITTREALIYKSEYARTGDGEYRVPTIRELATLMGFPYTYQFSLSEGVKWRQIGNAVSPYVSAALAKSVRIAIGLEPIQTPTFDLPLSDLSDSRIQNLNTFTEKQFEAPPQRKETARFRRHPFKEANMTVALTNYNPARPQSATSATPKWYSSVFIGTGNDFILKVFRKDSHWTLAQLIEKSEGELGLGFLCDFNTRFKHAFKKTDRFQAAFVKSDSSLPYEPNRLIEEIRDFIKEYTPKNDHISMPASFLKRQRVPTKQVLAMYAVNKLVS